MPRRPDAIIGRTSVRDALDSARVPLTAAGVDSPGLDAEVLLAAATGRSRAQLFSDPDAGLEPAQARRFMDMVLRRRHREPVAYILGTRAFRRLELRVDRRVLVPRPETEHLVEAALELPEGARVVDVGTGSGAVALALKDERPDLDVLGTDISAEALEVARGNAEALGLDVTFLHGDLLDPIAGEVDAVVSNPPYVPDGDRPALPADVRDHEPAGALFGGEDGLDVVRRLVPAMAAAGARFVALEIGRGQHEATERIVREAGFSDTRVDRDLAGIGRIVVGMRA